MKYLQMEKINEANIVRVIIEDHDPVFPGIPASERFAKQYLDSCMAVPDETIIEVNWAYNSVTDTFSPYEVPYLEPIVEGGTEPIVEGGTE